MLIGCCDLFRSETWQKYVFFEAFLKTNLVLKSPCLTVILLQRAELCRMIFFARHRRPLKQVAVRFDWLHDPRVVKLSSAGMESFDWVYHVK